MNEPTPSLAMNTARSLREDAQRSERERLLAEKTRPAREAAERERQMRAELHRLAALPGLADRLAAVCFDYAEHAEGRVMVRDQLSTALLGILLQSGLARDPRFQEPTPPRR
jgi:hypothetical protein